jgi:uncharacterized protein YneF (UPF0154 family)
LFAWFDYLFVCCLLACMILFIFIIFYAVVVVVAVVAVSKSIISEPPISGKQKPTILAQLTKKVQEGKIYNIN